MKNYAEKHNGWSKELHYRATWSSEGITSRASLLQKLQRHRNFCVGKHHFLSELIEKSAARNETTLPFPPLELALLRLGQPFPLLTASLVVNLKQHYQIIKQVMPLGHAVRTMKAVESGKLAAYPENRVWEYKIPSAPSVSNAIQTFKWNTNSAMAVRQEDAALPSPTGKYQNQPIQKKTLIDATEKWEQHFLEKVSPIFLAIHHLPRVEISPAQYFRRNSQVTETSQSFAAPGNNYPFIRTAVPPDITSATADTQVIETKVRNLVDTLYDHAIQSHAIPDYNLRMLSADSQETAQPIAANTQLTQRSEKAQIKSSAPVQLDRSDITRVADQVAKVLNHRMGLERERKGGFY